MFVILAELGKMSSMLSFCTRFHFGVMFITIGKRERATDHAQAFPECLRQ